MRALFLSLKTGLKLNIGRGIKKGSRFAWPPSRCDYASPSAKVAVNNYDYRDWSFRVESDDEFARKALRK